MDNLNQNHSGTGDNVGRDKITNNIQVKNDKQIRKAQEAYSKVYFWHKKFGKKIYDENYADEYGVEFSNQYHDFVDTLPAPEIADVDEMISVCKEFYNGLFAWSSSESIEPLSNKVRLIKFANEVINIKKKFTAKMFNDLNLKNQNEFYDKSKDILLESNKELKEVESKNLDSKRIGGLNAVIESSKQFDSPIVLTPELLGYKVVTNGGSLVENVKNEKITIEDIRLKTFSDEDTDFTPETNYYVELTLTNQTNSRINAVIPEGQIFENREYLTEERPTQNLATTEVYKVKLRPHQSKTIKIPAFCINQNYGSPNNKEGNLTIYEFIRKGFKNNDEIWEWIKRNYNDIVEKFK